MLGVNSLTTGASSTAAITRTSHTITNSIDVTTPGGPCALCIIGDTGKTLDGQNGDVTITGGGVVVNSTGTAAGCAGPNSGCAAYLNPGGNVKITTPEQHDRRPGRAGQVGRERDVLPGPDA